MDLNRFVHETKFWNRPVSGIHRSTLRRMRQGQMSPTLNVIQTLLDHTGRHAEVTRSTLTPLPLPFTGPEQTRLSSVREVPIFRTTNTSTTPRSRLTGDFKGLTVRHRTGQGGTYLLAMCSLIALGGGWECWAALPKGELEKRYFTGCTRIATGDSDVHDIAHLIADVAAQCADRPRKTPLLLTVDLATFVVANTEPDTLDNLKAIARDGAKANVFLNAGVKHGDHSFDQHLRDIEIEPSTIPGQAIATTAIVDAEPCQLPRLFLDFIEHGDIDDIDYRRYLVYAATSVGSETPS